uniref:Uncharacterized protein n=1 Tax=viral metagenome TaxID=1070528 RepID=A0A6M3LIJ3_9ZZZZ
MKTIGIIGSRSRNSDADFAVVSETFVSIYEFGDCICSGLCPKGGDRFAVLLAEIYETPVLWFPAQWDLYGKSAGFRRNADIAHSSDVLIACVAVNRKGGTEDTIQKFQQFHPNGIIFIV